MEKFIVQPYPSLHNDSVFAPISKIESPFHSQRQTGLIQKPFSTQESSPVNTELNLSTNLTTPAKKEAFRRITKPRVEKSFKNYPRINLKSAENSPFRPKNKMDSIILPLYGKDFDLIKIFTAQSNEQEKKNLKLISHIFKEKADVKGINSIQTQETELINLYDYNRGENVIDFVEEPDKPLVLYDRATFNLKKLNTFPTTFNRDISRSSYFHINNSNEKQGKPLSFIKSDKEKQTRKKRISKTKTQLKPIRKKERKSKKKVVCNCKNSMCVKLYCECYRNNGFCNKSCGCHDCKNHIRNPDHPRLIKENDGNTDQTLFNTDNQSKQIISKGCNCKRSKCLKKYCECFSHGMKCGDNCSCISCLNA